MDDLCHSEDWTCHEMWTRDSEKIYYHGNYENGLYYIGMVDPQSVLEGRKPDYIEISLPAEYKKYGHFTEGDKVFFTSDMEGVLKAYYIEVDGD